MFPVLVLAATLAGAPAPPDGTLLGVPVGRIWEAANGFNVRWLRETPAFARSGADYVGATALAATRPERPREPVGLDMSWTVSILDDERGVLEASFFLPADARFLVTGRFTHAGRTVETYTVVTPEPRTARLVAHNLGLKLPEGGVVPEDRLAAATLEVLRLDGISTTILLP